MSTLGTWIINSPDDAAQLVAFIKANAKRQVDAGRPLKFVGSVHRDKRSDKSNRYMWAAVLKPVSEQAQHNGKRYSEDKWHEAFKEAFLPEVCAAGIDKWEYLPNGSRRLLMSTTDLDEAEMHEYLQAVQAHAAAELGVVFEEPATA